MFKKVNITFPAMNHCAAILAILLITFLAINATKAEEEEDESCGNGCHTADPDPSQMSRCVRYACRRRVFRYFIRFGKRSDDDDAQQLELVPRLWTPQNHPEAWHLEGTQQPEHRPWLPRSERSLGRQEASPRNPLRQSKLLGMLLRFG